MPETLFTLSNVVVLPFWLLMILLPHWSVTKRLVASPLIALPTALLYSALVLPQAVSLVGMLTGPSLSSIAQLLSTPEAALIAWAHFVTFDLLVGRIEYLESRERNYSALWMAPVLFLTLMLGPLGFVTFLMVRYGHTIVRARTRSARDAPANA